MDDYVFELEEEEVPATDAIIQSLQQVTATAGLQLDADLSSK
jgi:hypothetical protein